MLKTSGSWKSLETSEEVEKRVVDGKIQLDA